MKKYIRNSSRVDPKTGKSVTYFKYLNSKQALDRSSALRESGFTLTKHKVYKHAWYSIFENDDEICVVYYGDGADNYTLPY